MNNPRKPTLAEWMDFMYDPQQAIDFTMTQLDDLIGERAADAESDNEDQ